MTRGQARALETLLPRYGVDVGGEADEPIRWPQWFGREAPLGLEIGFGMGHALVDWALAKPDWNIVGIEVYRPGIGALLLQAQQQDVTNLRVIEGDAQRLMTVAFLPASLSEVRVFFPDPWPKKRHAKRRLLQPKFVSQLAGCLVPGGRLWVATDWSDYADWTRGVLHAEPTLDEIVGDDRRVETRFEQRGLRLGHPICDLHFQRNSVNTESSSR